jgi:hypothetical protein
VLKPFTSSVQPGFRRGRPATLTGHGRRPGRGAGGLPRVRQTARGLDRGGWPRISPRGRGLLLGALRVQGTSPRRLRARPRPHHHLLGICAGRPQTLQTIPLSVQGIKTWDSTADPAGVRICCRLWQAWLWGMLGMRSRARATVRRRPNIGTPRAGFRGAF